MRRCRLVVRCVRAARARPSARRCRGSLGKWARIGCFLGRLTVPASGLSALLQPVSAPAPVLYLFSLVTRRCARAAGPGPLVSRRRRSTGRTFFAVVWLSCAVRGRCVFETGLRGAVLSVAHRPCGAVISSAADEAIKSASPRLRYRFERPSARPHDANFDSAVCCPSSQQPSSSKASRAHRSAPVRRDGPLEGQSGKKAANPRCFVSTHAAFGHPYRCGFVHSFAKRLQLRSAAVSPFDVLQSCVRN